MRVDVTDLMSDYDLGGTTFTRKRPAVTVANAGLATPTYTDLVMTGIVQPAATADANLLPEGTRLADVQAFFTAGEISVGTTSTLPDLLVDTAGAHYRVLHVQAFGLHGMTKALAQRIHNRVGT